MIQRASDSYLMRLTMPVEEGGMWHLHHRGIDAPTVPDLARKGFAVEVTLTPKVNDGRWIVECPFCGGAQLAAPSWTRFLCNDCANVAFGGDWLAVQWPEPDLVAAGEAALVVRPDPASRNWDPVTEDVGALVAENAIFGRLVDTVTGDVAGDTGHRQDDHMPLPSPSTPLTLSRGDDR